MNTAASTFSNLDEAIHRGWKFFLSSEACKTCGSHHRTVNEISYKGLKRWRTSCTECSTERANAMAINQASRLEARIKGHKRYTTGVPCLHGHAGERWVSTGSCVECGNKALRSWKNKGVSEPSSLVKAIDLVTEYFERQGMAELAAMLQATKLTLKGE